MENKSKLELLAMLFATVHFVSDKINADYTVSRILHTIRINISKPGADDKEFFINTNLTNLQEHIADVNARIYLLAK